MKWFALILALPFLLITGGLLINRPPLLSPPRPLERLKAYLATNVAETRLNHEFPELRSPLIRADTKQATDVVVKAMNSLGWLQIEAVDQEVRAIVVSPLFRFRDDVTVRLAQADAGTVLHARSASRIGKGDLAANARHLLDLFAEVERFASAR